MNSWRWDKEGVDKVLKALYKDPDLTKVNAVFLALEKGTE